MDPSTVMLSFFRGRIYEKYRNQSELARALGWNKQRLSRILTGAKTPTLAEVRELSKKLEMLFEDTANIFLSHGHQSGNASS